MRAIMRHRQVQYGPYVITLMEGNEPGYCEGQPLLVSISGPGLPALRLTTNGPEQYNTVDDIAPVETIIFGHFKGDRPHLGEREDIHG